MAEEEENKRKMKVGNNQKQWWWCLGWRSTHILMRWNAHVSVLLLQSTEKMKRLMNESEKERMEGVWYY